MRILITGGGGFVGRHLRAALTERFPAAAVITVEKSSSGGIDIADAGAVRDLVAAEAPTHIVNLAAVSTVGEAEADPRRAFAVNEGGVLNLGLAILEATPACTLLVVSSAEAYGASFAGAVPATERLPLIPRNIYAASKAAGEMAAQALVARGLRAVIARPFNHVGPGQDARFVLPAFARQIAMIESGRQEPVLRTGRLDAVRDFTDVRDIVLAYARVLERVDAIEPGTVINVASGTPRSIRSLLEQLLQRAAVPVRHETDPARVRPNDIPWACGDISLARDILGWEPRIPIETTLADLLTEARRLARD